MAFESLRDSIAQNIKYRVLTERNFKTLKDYATYFVLWYEYTKEVKLNIEGDLITLDVECGTAKLNKTIEEIIIPYLDTKPLAPYSAEYDGWEREALLTYRQIYKEDGVAEPLHTVYFLADYYVPFRNILDYLSMHYSGCSRYNLYDFDYVFDVDTPLVNCMKMYGNLFEASLMYIRKNFSFKPRDNKHTHILPHSEVFGIYYEGTHYLLVKGTDLYKVDLKGFWLYDDSLAWDDVFNCVLNDRYLYLYANPMNLVVGIDLESKAEIYKAKNYTLHRVRDEKLIKVIKRASVLNRG